MYLVIKVIDAAQKTGFLHMFSHDPSQLRSQWLFLPPTKPTPTYTFELGSQLDYIARRVPQHSSWVKVSFAVSLSLFEREISIF